MKYSSLSTIFDIYCSLGSSSATRRTHFGECGFVRPYDENYTYCWFGKTKLHDPTQREPAATVEAILRVDARRIEAQVPCISG